MLYQYNAGYYVRRAWEKSFPTGDELKAAIGLLESASTKDPVSGSKTSYGQNVVLSLAKNKQEWSLNYNTPTPFRILMQKKRLNLKVKRIHERLAHIPSNDCPVRPIILMLFKEVVSSRAGQYKNVYISIFFKLTILVNLSILLHFLLINKTNWLFLP